MLRSTSAVALGSPVQKASANVPPNAWATPVSSKERLRSCTISRSVVIAALGGLVRSGGENEADVEGALRG